MKKLMLAIVAVAAMVFGANAATYYPITINYAPETAVANFPVLVRIPAGSGIYQTAGEGGANLRFTDSLGINEYPHEVDTWNDAGESLVWVKIPELAKNFEFRLYCDGLDTMATKDVWSDYAGVWHLNEAKDSAEKDIDPADGVTHTTKIYGDAVDTAKIGKGYGQSEAGKGPTFVSQVYDNRNGHKAPIQVSDPLKFSVSCWVYVQDSATQWNLLFAPLGAQNGNTVWRADFSKASAGAIRVAQHGGDGNGLRSFDTPGVFQTWSKVDVVWNAKKVELYVNGALVGSATFTMDPYWGWYQWMGWGGYVDGTTGASVTGNSIGANFDECRIYDGVKSADRIAADYQTVMSQSFLTIGPATEEQDVPPGTVAQVGSDYYQVFAEAVAASKASGDFIILMANGQSWTFAAEGEALDIKVSGMDFTPNNGLGDGFYIDEALDSATAVTTFTLKKQVKVAAMRNVAVYKQLHTRDLADLLPAQVAGLAADGSIVGMFDVVWDAEDVTKYEAFGVTQVPGIATVGGERWPVTAFVRATLEYSDGYHNIAQETTALVVTTPAKGGYPFIDDVSQISEQSTSLLTNGLPATAVSGSWMTDSTGDFCNWKSNTKNPFVDVAMSWGGAKKIYRIDVIARGGGNNDVPKSLVIAADGEPVSEVMPTPNTNTRPKLNYFYSYDFETPIEAQNINVTVEQQDQAGKNVAIREILIWSDGTPLDKNEMSTSAELVELEMDGKPVKLEPGKTSYLVPKAKEVTLAKGEANVAVTVLPEVDGLIRIITMSEDGLSSKTYKIKTCAGLILYVR